MQSTFPASLDTWQVYWEESLGFTELSSRELEEASFFMKYEPPLVISFSSLNHLTAKGAVPVKAVLKDTVVPGIVSWFSDVTVNTGGSGGHERKQSAFNVSMQSVTQETEAQHKQSIGNL